MTYKVGNIIVFEATEPAKCKNCGDVSELRPYGKNGEWICFACGMLDEEETMKQFDKLFSGERDI